MAVKRSVLNRLHGFAFSKSGLPYGYGGQFSRTNPNASTDCSGVVGAASMFLASGGDDAMLYQRHGSTEQWRLDPDGRYAGLVKVASPAQIPADAVMRAGFQHGGGGEYSHTACTIEHANWESRGTPGVLYGSAARAWNDGLFHEFWYLPGPVVNDLAPHDFPLPAGFFFGPYDGPECSISGKAGEPRDWTDGLRRWQAATGIVQDGVYGPATAQKARELQRGAGFANVDGLIGARTWALAVKPTAPAPAPAPADPLAAMSRDDRVFHELTHAFQSRVPGSTYRDTVVGYVLNTNADAFAVRAEVERQGRVLDAIAAKVAATAA